jgi:hypothetical protein
MLQEMDWAQTAVWGAALVTLLLLLLYARWGRAVGGA